MNDSVDSSALRLAARALVEHEKAGTPELWNEPAFWHEWDKRFAALCAALSQAEEPQ